MGTEWYITAFENKEEQNISVEKLMKIFSEYIIQKSMNYNSIDLELDSGIISIYFDFSKDATSNLMISRPIIDKKLNEILYKTMRLGNFILFTSDGNYSIVLDKKIKNEFPNDMIEVLGTPKIAENEMEFALLLAKLYEA